jgi:ABC-type multidrug transport system fused ATPase/permease subunit
LETSLKGTDRRVPCPAAVAGDPVAEGIEPFGFAGLAILTFAAWGIALLAFVVVPTIWIGRRVRRLSRASQDRLADSSAIAAEILNGLAEALEAIPSSRTSHLMSSWCHC